MSLLDATAPGVIDIPETSRNTIAGEWVVQSVAVRSQSTDQLFAASGWKIPQSVRPQPVKLQEALREIRGRTGWSLRALAMATGTSHPTIDAVLRGDAVILARAPGLPRRIFGLYELVSRLSLVVDGDRGELVRALQGRPSPDRVSALEALAEGDLTEAYLAALDVLTPPRRTGMMRGRFPRRAGEASTALSGE